MTGDGARLGTQAAAGLWTTFKRGLRNVTRKIHRWIGLTALAWLFVLGTTGVILDHPDWRWTRQWTVTEALGSEHVLNDEVRGIILRQFTLNPANQNEMIAGGERGLWRTGDGGASWTKVDYDGYDGLPRLLALVSDPADPWDRIYLGTDDGIWIVNGGAGPAQPFALAGENVTHLSQGAADDELIGIVDNGRIFRLDTNDTTTASWIDVSRIRVDGMPTEIGLSRVMTDLHFGNAILKGSSSVLLSDYAGIAIAILCVTGFLQWLMPRSWRKRRTSRPAASRLGIMRWLFRAHAPVIGLLAIVPIIYLSVSGIVFDHPTEVFEWTNPVMVPASYLPAAYGSRGFDGELKSVAIDPESGMIAAMTRLGIIQSVNGGSPWKFDAEVPLSGHSRGGLIGLLRKQGATFLGTHGGPNFVRYDGSNEWVLIPGLRMMILDGVKIGDTWTFKGTRGFVRGTLDSDQWERLAVSQPEISGMPVYNFLVDLHTGLMFHDQWIWLNDVIAIIAIFLTITGFIGLLYRRWN